ncbi:MAG: hypothetical protein JSR17_08340 [Proteobacteria bacterium]|nr:hypothetical protein [Pseudomonadota bacterium]
MYRVLFVLLSICFFHNAFAEFNQLYVIQNEINAEQSKLQDRNIKDINEVNNVIFEMYQTDQKVRNLTLKDMHDPNVQAIIKQMDEFHTKKMKAILAEHQWITISKFGEKTADLAWLLIQHADEDPFFQAGCLYVMSHLEKSEYNLKNYAYLYDRVALKFQEIGMKQRYGTQVKIENGVVTLLPYDGTLEDVEQRRKEANLEPLNEYLMMIKSIYS